MGTSSTSVAAASAGTSTTRRMTRLLLRAQLSFPTSSSAQRAHSSTQGRYTTDRHNYTSRHTHAHQNMSSKDGRAARKRDVSALLAFVRFCRLQGGYVWSTARVAFCSVGRRDSTSVKIRSR